MDATGMRMCATAISSVVAVRRANSGHIPHTAVHHYNGSRHMPYSLSACCPLVPSEFFHLENDGIDRSGESLESC